MKFKMIHQNLNVLDLECSLAFYRIALGLHEKSRIAPESGEFIIVYLGNDESDFLLELTWLRARENPYELGENEFHLAFRTDDFEKAHELHRNMNCICYENPEMGIYFINDPDGYWLEVLPPLE